jgi:hypothetical protein
MKISHNNEVMLIVTEYDMKIYEKFAVSRNIVDYIK